VKSSWPSRLFSDHSVAADTYCSPPPFASARFVNTSTCLASSSTWLARNMTTSLNRGSTLVSSFAGR